MNILLTSIGRRSYLVKYFKEALKGNGEVHVSNSNAITPAFIYADKSTVTPLIYENEYIPFLLNYCVKNNIPVIPGTSTPSDMEAAMGAGLNVVKFFPAEQSGGVSYLKAVSGPYTNLKFIPTGGINTKNLNDYLSLKNVAACGGSWMVKSDLIDAGDFEAITSLTRDAVKTLLGFEIGHVGINSENEEEAIKTARAFSSIFGFEYRPGNSSIFSGDAVEVMKKPFLGKYGHIAIKTNSVERAISYLSASGVEFDESTKNTDEMGKIKAIYFKDQIGGFAVHLKK